MNLKLALLLLSFFSISSLFSQEETIIIQKFSNSKQSIENTILVNKNTITFKNDFFTIIQIRGEYVYQIYSDRLKGIWEGYIKNFYSDYSDFLQIVLDEYNINVPGENIDELRELISINNAILINDSIVSRVGESAYTKKLKTKNKLIIADKECQEYEYYKDTHIKARVSFSKEFSKKDTEDIIKLWEVVDIINKSSNTDISFSLSFLDNSSTFPMKAIQYKDNGKTILKEETVEIVEKQGLSKCKCENTNGYTVLTLVDLIMGSKELNSK